MTNLKAISEVDSDIAFFMKKYLKKSSDMV